MEPYVVPGMSCAACQARAEKAVGKMSGVISAKADHLAGRAIVRSERGLDEALLPQAVEAEDYQTAGIRLL